MLRYAKISSAKRSGNSPSNRLTSATPSSRVMSLRADLLRGVVGRAADAELDVRRVVVEVVDPIVDAVVLAVGAGRALRRGLEAAVLDCVVVAALRVPLQIVAEIVHLDLLASRSAAGSAGKYGTRSAAGIPNLLIRSCTETPPR